MAKRYVIWHPSNERDATFSEELTRHASGFANGIHFCDGFLELGNVISISTSFWSVIYENAYDHENGCGNDVWVGYESDVLANANDVSGISSDKRHHRVVCLEPFRQRLALS